MDREHGATNGHIRFVAFRYSHHSPHSGYSRLAEYGMRELGGQLVKVDSPLSRRLVRERILRRVARGTPGYDRAAMSAELQVAYGLLTERHSIYHFLYGETTYHHAGRLNNLRGNRVVASFHLPPSGMREAMRIDHHLRRLSAAVCLGRNQAEFFAGMTDPPPVFFVPLGIDTDYYTPPPFDERQRDLCLFVGESYRDFLTLRGVIELLAFRRPATKFVAVVPARTRHLLGTPPNLTILSGIPETELLALYRSASLLVLPLYDAVANNAVLEAMACGLAMVVTDIGATREYVGDSCAILTRAGDSRGMADAVLALLEDPEARQNMGRAGREQASRFSWTQVVETLRTVYSAVA